MLQHYNSANRDLIVNISGRLVHRDQAGISPFDSAVQGGDAVWEGLRLYDGRIFALTEHLARLRSSAKALAFAHIPTDEEITREIRRTLAANHMFDNVHIRLTLTRGEKYTSGMDPRLNRRPAPGGGAAGELVLSPPTLIVLAEHKPPVYDPFGIALITSTIRRFPPDCLDPKIHHCNLIQSILAKIQANEAGADDALMLDLRGFVAETNATHIFVVSRDANAWTAAERNRAAWQAPSAPRKSRRPHRGGGKVIYDAPDPNARDPEVIDPDAGGSAQAGLSAELGPPPYRPGPGTPVVLTPFCHACPEGITRASVLRLCRENGIPHAEADLSLTELYRADEVFCTGTMGGLAPVLRLDGRAIGDGKAGAMTQKLSGLYRSLVRLRGVRVADRPR